MKRLLIAGVLTSLLVGASTMALAKLPAPSDEARAKAAEAAAKAAWSGKLAAYQLCKVQDRVAADYLARAKAAGKDVGSATPGPACVDPGPFSYVPPASTQPGATVNPTTKS
jgi:hypothetical protein